jgi:hypothetical protein
VARKAQIQLPDLGFLLRHPAIPDRHRSDGRQIGLVAPGEALPHLRGV